MLRAPAALSIVLCAGCALLAKHAEAQAVTSLASVLEDVRAQSPSLAAARSRIAAAHRMHDASGRPGDPMLSVELDRVGWASGAGSPMLRYKIEQPLPTPGALGMEERVAERAAEQAQADLITLQRELESESARAYVMLWRAQGELEVVQAQHQLVQNLIAAALARMSSGADTHHDVLQSEVEIAALQDETARISAERTAAIAMINALRNQPDSDSELVAGEPLALPDHLAPTATLLAQALRTRSELRSVQAMAEGERAMAQLESREAWPMLSVGAWYTQDLEMPDSIGLMVSGTLPVFSSGRQSARASASLGRANAAEAEQSAFELMIGAQVRSSVARYEATQERVRLLRDVAVPRAEQALAQANSSYRTGMLAFASVVQDERTLADLRMKLVAARAERYDAYIALLRALGRELGAPLAKPQ